MSKLIQSNPYRENSSPYKSWAEGFEAGQKSTLTPVSVTGRWWQSRSGKIYFAHAIEYDAIQQAVDKNPDLCRWLSEEEAREFT